MSIKEQQVQKDCASMPFPETERVIYDRNPLRQVICQLRFPPILKIDNETPADFQELVRHRFSEFKVIYDEPVQELPQGFSQQLPSELLQFLSPKRNPRYQFLTKHENSSISLTRDFVALETEKYECWDDFQKDLKLMLSALIQVYQPAYLTRIGLRYKNVIDRRRLKIPGTPWSDLLADFVLGQFALTETSAHVLEQQGRSLMKLNENGDLVRIEYGQTQDPAGDSTNRVYLLDNDFYTNQEVRPNEQDVISRLTTYNRLNRNLFAWCVRKKLHDAMEPRDR